MSKNEGEVHININDPDPILKEQGMLSLQCKELPKADTRSTELKMTAARSDALISDDVEQ